MGKYMILYKSSTPPGEQMASGSAADTEAMMGLWMAWAGKAGSALLDLGSPLGLVGSVGKADKGAGQHIGGFSLLEADTADAVKKLLDGHPHLQAPGDGCIEILEFLPIPGM